MIPCRRLTAQACTKDTLIYLERGFGARRRLGTVLVLTTNFACCGLENVAVMIFPACCEKSELLGSGGSIVAMRKLKGIDAGTPQGVDLSA